MLERQVRANLQILEAYKEDLKSSNDEVTSSIPNTEHQTNVVKSSNDEVTTGPSAGLFGREYMVAMFVLIRTGVPRS